MGIIDPDRLWENIITGHIALIALVIIGHYDRILQFILYKLFNIKIHSHYLNAVCSICLLFIGYIILILSLIPTFIDRPLSTRIFFIILTFFFLWFWRWLAKKTNYFYFPLDDEYYHDKNGNDIRDIEQTKKNKKT